MEHRTSLRKNQQITVKIKDIGIHGEGIGKIDGYPLFVKDAVMGDEALVTVTKVGKTFGFGHLDRVLSPSQNRIEPKCPHAKVCGGCQLQALSYEKQLAFKEQKVTQNLIRIGGLSEEMLQEIKEPILSMEEPWHYRNKEQFPVAPTKDGHVGVGFFASHSHRIVEIEDCAIAMPGNREIVEVVKSWMETYHITPYDEKTGKGLIRHIVTRVGFHTGQWMVTLVVNTKKLNRIRNLDVLVDALSLLPGIASICLSPNTTRGNVILGDRYETIWGKSRIEDTIGNLHFRISPLSFFQVNPRQTERLYQTALSYADLSGNETVWDLYCGIGTVSLFLAQKAKKVVGVEIVPQAVEDAKENAKRNHIENAVFYTGKAEEVAPKYLSETGEIADVVVVDPPRKGCDEKLLSTIVKMQPDKIVYISCDSATLARDIKILSEQGYHLQKYRACDMFPQGVHVEAVVLLSRVGTTK